MKKLDALETVIHDPTSHTRMIRVGCPPEQMGKGCQTCELITDCQLWEDFGNSPEYGEPTIIDDDVTAIVWARQYLHLPVFV